jgi:hypothetical protein
MGAITHIHAAIQTGFQKGTNSLLFPQERERGQHQLRGGDAGRLSTSPESLGVGRTGWLGDSPALQGIPQCNGGRFTTG